MLLVLGFVAIILALILGLSRLRAVEETDAAVDSMLAAESQAEAYAAEKEILEDSQVTVKITETKTSDDALVKGFLEGVE